MKSVRTFLTLLILASTSVLSTPLFSHPSDQQMNVIEWQTNYNNALAQAKQKSLPVVLFFTGSDWCTWCNKIENEALDTPEFAQAADGKFIFVKLDYPMYKKLDGQTTQQNNSLKQKYDIKGYPTVIIIDSNERVLGSTGYVAGGGRNYANHLRSIANQ